MPRARVQHRHLPRRAPWTCSRRAPPATRTGRSRAPHPTLGEAGEELDLSGAHLSYGDFEEATFQAEGAIRLNGPGPTRRCEMRHYRVPRATSSPSSYLKRMRRSRCLAPSYKNTFSPPWFSRLHSITVTLLTASYCLLCSVPGRVVPRPSSPPSAAKATALPAQYQTYTAQTPSRPRLLVRTRRRPAATLRKTPV